jgi:hypothetical protein
MGNQIDYIIEIEGNKKKVIDLFTLGLNYAENNELNTGLIRAMGGTQHDDDEVNFDDVDLHKYTKTAKIIAIGTFKRFAFNVLERYAEQNPDLHFIVKTHNWGFGEIIRYECKNGNPDEICYGLDRETMATKHTDPILKELLWNFDIDWDEDDE